MLEAIFQEGILSLTLAGLTQWDYGQKLTIKGLTVSSALEVHFSNNAEKEAIVMSATKSGSDIITEIPNVLLEKDKDITAWVYTDDGQSGETIRTIVLKVTPRIKPADYISENNAGEVIDYVAMAEEYANSAQESAKSAQDNAEQVQVNTDIVKDLLANVPDFDSYEKLAEHNKLLYDGLYVKGETYSGIASNKGIKLHKVVGKTEQGTTKGYQLFDASKLPTTSAYGAIVTNNNDGSFTISGSGNISSANYINEWYDEDIEHIKSLLKVGKITSVVEKPTNPRFLFQVYVNSKVNPVINLDVGTSSTTKSATITEDILADVKKIRIGFYGDKDSTIKSSTIKPMVYQDGDGTWEPFTDGKPGPNPDGAIPIKNVEINKINSGTNQLFDDSKIQTKSQGGADVKNNNDGSFTISGSGSLSEAYDNRYRLSHDETLKLLKVGTISIQSENTEPFFLFSLSGSSGPIFEINCISESSKTATITEEMLNDEGLYCTYGFYGRNATKIKTGTIKPMLYQDGDGTWEPFKHATVETSIILADGEVYEEGQPILRRRKKVLFDGSSDEDWTLNPSWTGSSDKYAYFYTRINDIKSNLPFFIANRFKCITDEKISIGYEGEAVYKDSIVTKAVYFSILKSRLSSNDEDGFKKWLQSHPIEFEYELETPTTEKLKVPTIPSYNPQTNIWTDNTLPTDIEWELLANSDNSLYQEELEKRIQALEAQILGL